MSDGLYDPANSQEGAEARPGHMANEVQSEPDAGSQKRRRKRSRRRRGRAHLPAPERAETTANTRVCGEADAHLKGAQDASDTLQQTPGGSPARARKRRKRRNKSDGFDPLLTATPGAENPKNSQTPRSQHRSDPNLSRHSDKGPSTNKGLHSDRRFGRGRRANSASSGQGAAARAGASQERYAALDLGTNNCRLLVAEPKDQGFRVVDAFSRIVRLGDGMASSGALGDEAMMRAIGALKICSRKLAENQVKRARLIATEACRYAENGPDFLASVEAATGLQLEIVDRETEARLAVAGCSSLVHPRANGVILFDIGGGSSELVWLDLKERRHERGVSLSKFIRAWTSLPVGVVTLSEKFGGVNVTQDIFESMVHYVSDLMAGADAFAALDDEFEAKSFHLLGTSGTVTTLAGIHLNLQRYDRRRVDGLWMTSDDVTDMMDVLVGMDYASRVGNPCIGSDRADLVLAGCAIFEAFRRRWPCRRIRVADRGLREGILIEMMAQDRVWRRRKGPSHRRASAPNSQRPTTTPIA